MATSEVEICNSALIKIGAPTISALSDNSRAANLCNNQYNKIRKKLLRSHPWNFAVVRAELALTANTPSYGYTHEFALPSDVLRVLDTNLVEGSLWDIEHSSTGSRVLVCNSSTIKIKYIKDITNTTVFDSTFEDALSYLLASELAYPLVQSANLKKDMYRMYKAEVAEARSFDAQEASMKEVQANPWIDVRA